MSNSGQTTPFRIVDNSPQFFTRHKKQSPSPYSKRVAGETALKSILITTRKIEELTEKNQKLRELQAKMSQLQQKLAQLQQENMALQQTLSERTSMYKRILSEQQKKTQQTIQSLKEQFRVEFKQLNQEKQEEERFFHEESSVLNQKIDWLENENAQLQQRLNQQIGLFNDMMKMKEKLEVEHQKNKQQYDAMNKQKTEQILKLQQAIVKYLQEFKHEKRILNEGMTSLGQEKQNQIIQLKEKLQNEIKTLQNLRQNENIFKDNEIAELKRLLQIQKMKFAHTLQAEKLKYEHLLETQNLKSQKSIDEESRRLVEGITIKERQIDMLKRDIAQLESNLSLSESENAQLKGQIALLQNDGKSLSQELFETAETFSSEKSHLHDIITQLKEELHLNQTNYVTQRQNNEFLSVQNRRLRDLSQDRELLISQIKQLRQLLLQSSAEIENCRSQFLIFERQNKRLVFELEKLGSQTNALLRIRRQLQEQAIKWRQNYIRATR